MALEIDIEECLGCGACESACPQGAVSQGGAFPVSYEVDPLLCNDCQQCLVVCPVDGLLPDADWTVCHGRGCPLSSSRYAGTECSEGRDVCPDMRFNAVAGRRWRLGVPRVRGGRQRVPGGFVSEDQAGAPPARRCFHRGVGGSRDHVASGPMEQLEGKAAVVTGAASGIGLAIVEAFVAEGMHVVMTDIDDENLAAQAARLADHGAAVHAVVADVADPDARSPPSAGPRSSATGGSTWRSTTPEWSRGGTRGSSLSRTGTA